ncbi:MAG: hypothetical protein QM697_05930 [Lachnospiraceae bacterium]
MKLKESLQTAFNESDILKLVWKKRFMIISEQEEVLAPDLNQTL